MRFESALKKLQAESSKERPTATVIAEMISNYKEKLEKNSGKFKRKSEKDIFNNTREPFKASNHFGDIRKSTVQTLSPN